jgi:hypothetical protein
MIQFRCSICKAGLRVSDDMTGMEGRCPKSKVAFIVPSAAAGNLNRPSSSAAEPPVGRPAPPATAYSPSHWSFLPLVLAVVAGVVAAASAAAQPTSVTSTQKNKAAAHGFLTIVVNSSAVTDAYAPYKGDPPAGKSFLVVGCKLRRALFAGGGKWSTNVLDVYDKERNSIGLAGFEVLTGKNRSFTRADGDSKLDFDSSPTGTLDCVLVYMVPAESKAADFSFAVPPEEVVGLPKPVFMPSGG